MELQPPLFIGNLRIGEPMTALTDLVVAGVCFVVFWKLRHLPKSPLWNLFRWHFLFLGLATLWGGIITHAFLYLLNPWWRLPGWISSMVALTCLGMATVQWLAYNQWKRKVAFAAPIFYGELGLVILVTLLTGKFDGAAAHSAVIMLFVMVLFMRANQEQAHPAFRLMVLGVVGFIASGIAYLAKVSVHTWFNHVDFTHVLLAIDVLIFYMAILKLRSIRS